MENIPGNNLNPSRKTHASDPDFGILPNFFLIGCAKAGTTSLFNMLVQHAEIYGPPEKEPRFFNDDEKFHKGTGWYQKTYYKNARSYLVRCDATPAYLIWSEKVAPRIQDLYQDNPVRFGVIFRDPVQQAYSHYWQRVRQGVENLSFVEALEAEDARLVEHWEELERRGNGKFGYFRAGCYATRLQPFLDRFPQERFHFLRYEDLGDNKKITRLLEFLGVDASIVLKLDHSNQSMMPVHHRIYTLVRRYRKASLVNLLRKIIPSEQRSRLRKVINDHLLAPYSYPQLDETVEKTLRERYAPDVHLLEQITGWNLSCWLPKKDY